MVVDQVDQAKAITALALAWQSKTELQEESLSIFNGDLSYRKGQSNNGITIMVVTIIIP